MAFAQVFIEWARVIGLLKMSEVSEQCAPAISPKMSPLMNKLFLLAHARSMDCNIHARHVRKLYLSVVDIRNDDVVRAVCVWHSQANGCFLPCPLLCVCVRHVLVLVVTLWVVSLLFSCPSRALVWIWDCVWDLRLCAY